ncbi:uncharacterized protein LOC119665470 [Teleopsis dalmanni]|uniref:uncharacterized protein LOC119665470 n=1 Tax=Teleopsis dalmanni TaxID=139649 RepID=UPI0018CCD306|nr:uncharacterized protein LOC119665470 [Teleopsis dalmanni]
MTVISWINTESALPDKFITNRIAVIQELTTPDHINSRYVSSKDNPADFVSRGVSPQKMSTCHLWFYGPQFLHGDKQRWPVAYDKHWNIDYEHKFDLKEQTTSLASMTTSQEEMIYTINHRNSFKVLNRIVAYVLRFIKQCKVKNHQRKSSILLTPEKLNESLNTIIKVIQSADFKDEMRKLLKSYAISPSSLLNGLAPFVNTNGIIRVAGRLETSSLSYHAKHPMALPYNDPLVTLLMQDTHKKKLHYGPQTLLAQVRQKCWPIKGLSMARSVVQHCIRC